MSTFKNAAITRNPAWIQLLGLCPLLAVSDSVVNALGLSLASLFVVTGSSIIVSSIRNAIPEFARLPIFVLIIATFTTLTTLFLEAFAYEVYLRIALFVQIIVTNCMILGRAESYASKQPVGRACLDALGTGSGFALALLALGAIREIVGSGTLFTGMDALLGEVASNWTVYMNFSLLPLANYPPGAFIIAGLLFALGKALFSTADTAKPINLEDAAANNEQR